LINAKGRATLGTPITQEDRTDRLNVRQWHPDDYHALAAVVDERLAVDSNAHSDIGCTAAMRRTF